MGFESLPGVSSLSGSLKRLGRPLRPGAAALRASLLAPAFLALHALWKWIGCNTLWNGSKCFELSIFMCSPSAESSPAWMAVLVLCLCCHKE